MSRSHHALPLRLNIPHYFMRDLGAFDLTLIDTHDVVAHRARIDESVAIYNRHAVIDALIDVGHIGDVVDGHIVVNVGDLHVCHTSVANVHVLHVTRAGAIPRNENFTRP